MMLGMCVKVSLCMFTVSNALLMSKATATVRCEGFGLLKPFVIWWKKLCKAMCVECLHFAGMFSVICGNSVFFSVLAMGDKSDSG